jgi:CPA2 family monovalent cation:H+ antiporter-2
VPHAAIDLPLLSTLVVGLGLALVLGYVAHRLRFPPLVGYIFAGILAGHATPGFAANAEVAHEFAEIGVMLLLFGVGLHFSPKDLLAARNVVVPGALAQMILTTATGTALALWWGWPVGSSLVLGSCLSIASTVVLLKALESRGETNSPFGRIAMGWLVVEDFAAIIVLVLLPAFDGRAASGSALAGVLRALGLSATFVVLMLAGGRKLFPAVLWRVARTGSRELFTLCVVVVAVGIAYGAGKIFGVSYALGAFLSGMVLRESDFSHRAAERVLPLQDAFSVLFFVSLGMVFHSSVLWHRPLQVLELSSVVVAGKLLWGTAVVLLRGQPLSTALAMGAGIAQIGEFSFILAGAGMALGILPPEAMDLVLAAAIVSISLHAQLSGAVPSAIDWLRKHVRPGLLDRAGDPLSTLPQSTPLRYLTGQVVLVGYAGLGAKIAESLLRRAIPFVVVDESSPSVEALRRRGIPAVRGDASDPGVLVQAHIMRAGMLLVTTSDPVRDASMILTARTLNPPVEIVFHADGSEDAQRLRGEGCAVFLSDDVLSEALSAHVAARFGK